MGASLTTCCYNAGMTLVEITYELQSPLTQDQLRRLGEFSNTYGLPRFRFDESKKHLSFEYDASRLQDTQIAHVLGQATIAVARRVSETSASPGIRPLEAGATQRRGSLLCG